MKNIRCLGFALAFCISGIVTAARAADRCDGLVPTTLIRAERVSDMYFDMRLAELQCHYVQKNQKVLNKIALSIGRFKSKNAPCIKAAQDNLVVDLGSENAFDDYYAKLGNEIVLVNVEDPCGRALQLSVAMSKPGLTCGSNMVAAYLPWFGQLDNAYLAIQKQSLTRICDK